MCGINKIMRNAWKEFLHQNGCEPKFAMVAIQFDGEDETVPDVIKVSGFDREDTMNDEDGNSVVFFADGINELCQINDASIADFRIVDFYEFTDELW